MTPAARRLILKPFCLAGVTFLPLAMIQIGSACGCLTVGYPAIDLVVIAANSELPVPLGNSILIFTDQSGRRDSILTSALNGNNQYTHCCVRGPLQIHLAVDNYAAWDTTVTVRTTGRCDVPRLKRITVRLRPD